jgi:P-loop containing dynein motor region
MANYLTPATTQEQLEAKLVKRGRDMFISGVPGEKVFVAVDDMQGAPRLIIINSIILCSPFLFRDATGASPTIEMLRLFMDNSGWYHTKSLEWRKIHDIQ